MIESNHFYSIGIRIYMLHVPICSIYQRFSVSTARLEDNSLLLSCMGNLHTSIHLTYWRGGNDSSITNALSVPQNWLVNILEACERQTECVVPRSSSQTSANGRAEHQVSVTPSCTKMIPESMLLVQISLKCIEYEKLCSFLGCNASTQCWYKINILMIKGITVLMRCPDDIKQNILVIKGITVPMRCSDYIK